MSSTLARIGFIGLGTMGTPMAINLTRKFPTTVWNRSPSKYAALADVGATVGESPASVAQQSDIIYIMLFDEPAIQSVFDDEFKKSLAGRTVINTSSVSVGFSHQLAKDVADAGADFIEMPVSGSKVPATQGTLVGMIAGDVAVVDRIRPCLEPITSKAVYCGNIGSGLKTKYAANLYVTALAAGLAESMNLARAQGLNLEAFGAVLNAGPMASPYAKVKIDKIQGQDWSPQASVKDCHKSAELIKSAVETAGAKAPLADLLVSLYRQAAEAGFGEEDMIAIYKFLQ